MSKKRIIGAIVTVAMMLSTFGTLISANAAVGAHSTDVPAGYIAIRNKADMLTMMNYGIENANVEKTNNYILMSDIAFEAADFAEGGAFYNAGKGWAPLGIMASYPYKGVFDGNGYSVSGLVVNNDIYNEEGNCGLIGVNAGEIKNLHMKDSTLLINTGAEPNLTYAVAYGGGVVGVNLGEGVVENCSSTGMSVTARSTTVSAYAGGIAGSNAGTINNCFVANSKIKAVTSSNRTDRTDKAIVGGIAGACKNATMWNVMVTKDVELTVETAIDKEGNNGKGFIVGESNIMTKVAGGFYPDGTEFAGMGNSSKAVCIPLTEAQYKQTRYFGSFDFTNVWEMGAKHPVLRVNGNVETVVPEVTAKVELPEPTSTPTPITEAPKPTPTATPTLVTESPIPTASAEPSENPRPIVGPSRMSFAKKSVKIKRGKKVVLKLRGKVTKKAKFSISKGKKVVKLMKKKAKQVTVKGVKKGKATVVAKVAGKKAQCKVTVK